MYENKTMGEDSRDTIEAFSSIFLVIIAFLFGWILFPLFLIRLVIDDIKDAIKRKKYQKMSAEELSKLCEKNSYERDSDDVLREVAIERGFYIY